VNDIAHERRIDPVWEGESKKPLLALSRQKILDYFTLWEKGHNTPYPYYDETVEKDVDEIKRTLNLRPNTPVVSLFSNTVIDSAVMGIDSAFESIFDWLFKVIEYARKRPDIDFVVRAHPAEIKEPAQLDWFEHNSPVCDEIRARCAPLPSNVKLVEPTSPFSSYTIGALSDVVMVYTSTLGIEFALRGKRPWVAANPYYAGKGFTLDLESHEHMVKLLDENHFDNALEAEEVELAERFAHIVTFRRPFALPYYDGETGRFTPPSMDVFAAGGNPVIDNLCSYILNGRPFLDIGSEKALSDEDESSRSPHVMTAPAQERPSHPEPTQKDPAGDRQRLQPISRKFGLDRGTSICRYYIDQFLTKSASHISGRVLEIGDDAYTKRFGSGVTQSDVLNVVPTSQTTIVGDLATGLNIPQSVFDCIIMTQTIQVIYDVKATLRNVYKALKPGGTLLLTAHGISQISQYDMDRWGEYWRFTDKSLRMLLGEIFPEEDIQIETYGNVASAKAYLDGLAAEELSQEILDFRDVDYQVLITARVRKPPNNAREDAPSQHGSGGVRVNVVQEGKAYETIVADDDLQNVKSMAKERRFGRWQVEFRGLKIHCQDLMAFYISAKDIFIKRIYDFESSHSEPMVFDGGGHIGLFALFARQKYPRARITVFEPEPTAFELLSLNLQENGYADVKVVRAGLYKRRGEISFASKDSDGSSIYAEERNMSIVVHPLSDYLDSEVDFLKLNIEGAELDVISEIEPRLHVIKEMVIGYHGFPELGQNLHQILTILDRAGFRYMIHDFDAETNPFTKPPFKLRENTRFYLLVHAKKPYTAGDRPSARDHRGNDLTPAPAFVEQSVHVAGQEVAGGQKSDSKTEVIESFFEELDTALQSEPLSAASKINEYLKAMSYLEQNTLSCGYPALWDIETTNRCAMTCNHCPRTALLNRTLQDMDIRVLRDLLRQARPYAQHVYGRDGIVKYIHYGEPTLYRLFGESIAFANSLGFRVTTSSTASAFHDKAIKEVVESQLDQLWLIFDGMDDETFRKIRGKGASFQRGLKQLEKLLDYRSVMKSSLPDIKVVMIKHPDNRHQWEEFNRFFSSINGVSSYLGHFSTFAGNVESINRLQRLIADDPEEAKEIERVARLNEHVCYYPWHSVSVLADGRVVPCCRDVNGSLVLGDLRHQSLLEIWKGEKIRELREAFLRRDRDNPLCQSCKEGSLEIGIPDAKQYVQGKALLDQIVLSKSSRLRELLRLDQKKKIHHSGRRPSSSSLQQEATSEEMTSQQQLATTPSFRTPLILLYHRVADEPIDAQMLAVSPKNFEDHLKILVKDYRVLPLYELLSEVNQGQLRRDTVAITFDDGYLDVLTNAVPFLEKHGLHATVFVTSGLIGSERGFWGDVVERVLLTGLALPDSLSVKDSNGEDYLWELVTPHGRLKAHDEIRALLRSQTYEEIREFVDSLAAWAGLGAITQTTRPVVDIQGLRRLAASPAIEVGSHTVTHTRLSILPTEQQRREIRGSKLQLESMIGGPVRLFSYPYGTKADYTEETKVIAAREGYEAVVANIQGQVTSPVDPFAIPRRLVRNWSAQAFAGWLKENDKHKLEEETLAKRDRVIVDYLANAVSQTEGMSHNWGHQAGKAICPSRMLPKQS
jgi:FkbM family methyltransferase